VTRYGNVMASRGSVIPLFIEQIKSGQPNTITDQQMTRFMMSLDEAVDLVMFAFENAEQGDIMVQKASASTIRTLVDAVNKIFGTSPEEKHIGIRHGEKMYETLLTKEEGIHALDMGDFYRVAADNRDLNYDKYFEEGKSKVLEDEFNSDNTYQLNPDELAEKLLEIDYIQDELAIQERN